MKTKRSYSLPPYVGDEELHRVGVPDERPVVSMILFISSRCFKVTMLFIP